MSEADQDLTETLAGAVRQAAAEQQPMSIVGTGSKAFLLPAASRRGARLLNVSEHRGIVEYRPDELVITARSGTSLKTLRQVLQRADQMLPFEPPQFRYAGTLGGALASGLAGSARPWQGGVRDAVLGVKLLDGSGQILRFGGSVVKNVAGYDVSRLQAGAFGTLGLLLEISLRVIPRAQAEVTLCFETGAEQALGQMREWARTALPLSGLCHVDGQLYVRLRGAESAVAAAAGQLGGQVLSDTDFWQRLDNHQHGFFSDDRVLLRQQPPPGEPLPADFSGLIEWAGARRWQYRDAQEALPAQDWSPFDNRFASRQCCLPGGNRLLADYQQRLRAVFDPHQLFNPDLSDADLAA